ncbi:MAG: DUF1464 family protein [Nitrososphaerota archaeon]
MGVRVAGIDPGTRSFDILGLEDDRVILDVSIPSEEVAARPGILIDVLRRAGPLDLIVGPSGYGIALKHISEIDDKDIFLMTLVRPEESDIPVLVGLKRVVKELRKTDLNIYFIPGVVHLPTVPAYRKINAIDMGTADKLCCAALALYDYTTKRSLPLSEASVILVEVGYGYNAVIAIDRGVVVDGVGGTRAGPGFLTSGGLDGEVAYLLGALRKEMLFKGGVKTIAGGDITPESLPEEARVSGPARIAWYSFLEGVEKNVWSLVPVMSRVDAILLSGRLSRVEAICSELAKRLSRLAPVSRVGGFKAASKEAAQGAALIANGLAGGFAEGLIEHMRIREAGGTVLDYVVVEDLKQIYLRESTTLKNKQL